MSRLIDADELKLKIVEEGQQSKRYKIGDFWELNRNEIWGVIDDLPTIERKKGKWQWLSSTYDRTPCEMRYMCSECHHETILHSNETSYPWEKFCPNCGADMRGEK